MALDCPLMLALVRAIGSPSCDTNLVHTALSGILIPTECTPGLRSGLRCELRSNISVNGPGRRSFNNSSPTEQFAHLRIKERYMYNTCPSYSGRDYYHITFILCLINSNLSKCVIIIIIVLLKHSLFKLYYNRACFVPYTHFNHVFYATSNTAVKNTRYVCIRFTLFEQVQMIA